MAVWKVGWIVASEMQGQKCPCNLYVCVWCLSYIISVQLPLNKCSPTLSIAGSKYSVNLSFVSAQAMDCPHPCFEQIMYSLSHPCVDPGFVWPIQRLSKSSLLRTHIYIPDMAIHGNMKCPAQLPSEGSLRHELVLTFKHPRWANTAMSMLLTGCETEKHIWKYGCEWIDLTCVKVVTLLTWKTLRVMS